MMLFVLYILLDITHIASSSTVAYQTVITYRGERICASYTWFWCSRHRWIYHPVYGIRYKCAPGYGGSSCSPICQPACKNGACTSPGYCKCDAAFQGRDCGKIQTCSFRKPCFPGVCGYNDQCQCANGFKSGGSDEEGCLLFEDSQKPKVTRCTTKLINLERSTQKEQYRYVADSSSPDISEPDVMWSNQRDFNFINIYFEGQYESPEIVTTPDYIRYYKFGVTSGSVKIEHTKIPRKGEPPPDIKPLSFPCENSPGPQNPETETFKCNITRSDYTTSFESGDKNIQTQDYVGQYQRKSMIFKFDFGKPYYSTTTTNQTLFLYVSEEITKKEFSIYWKGWKDAVSGVYNYTWQVFPLVPDNFTSNLAEKNTSDALSTNIISAEEFKEGSPYKYKPDGPGMYSIILEISDQADNKEFGRTLVLYDPVSNISVSNDDGSKIIVKSAQEGSNWLWQSTVDDEHPIKVSWRGHFRNKLHEEKKLLNTVNRFKTLTRRVSDSKPEVVLKSVPLKYEDKSGKRSLSKIKNIHGIVGFQYAFRKDNQGGSTSENVPTNTIRWEDVDNFTAEEVSFTTARSDGDTIRIWIKACDAMGNKATNSVVVHFDSTQPIIKGNETRIEKNQDSSNFYYGSRIRILTYDEDSGIKQINMRFIYNETNKLFRSRVTSVNFTYTDRHTASSTVSTVCITTGQCFSKLQYVYFDNCWLVVPKARLDTQVIRVELIVYNQAMLTTTTTLKMNNLRSLNGIENYNGPLNLTVVRVTDTGVRLRWQKMPTCYNITVITVEANSTTGTNRFYNIEKGETEFNLAGLDPVTNYTMVFTTHYEEERSDPVIFSVVTHATPPSGLSIGGKVGVSLTIILLVGVIITGVVLWRTGHLAKTREVIRYRLTVYRKAAPEVTVPGDLKLISIVIKEGHDDDENIKSTHQFFSLKVEKEYDDDIYMYGEMDVKGKQNWLISSDDIILEKLLTSGRFAEIFMARYNTKQGKTTLVIAKILKHDCTEEDKVLMQAKINFYATQVGDHPNVLAFIGSVENNAALGPYMVLEFCENGNLRDWLNRQKHSVTEETVESMHGLSLGIAKGMEYLASKEIVHRRLAARNVLLTEDLSPKIAGFGPTTTSNEQEGDDSTTEKERIPVKWVAPECIKSMKDATTESDVWSYGVVLWEIFSLGDPPYPGIRSKEIPRRVKSGYRMKRPENANDEQYDMMKRCWAEKPKHRPSFTQIVEEINQTFSVTPAADDYYMES